jgi:hypothetical protein
MLRAVVIFFHREDGVDYRVRIPAIQTKAGGWAIANLAAGTIEFVDAMDDMIAEATAEVLDKHRKKEEEGQRRTVCAQCHEPFETGPNIQTVRERFLHLGCWSRDEWGEVAMISAYLAKGVTVPHAKAVTRTTGVMASQWVAGTDWEAGWNKTYRDIVTQLIYEDAKDKSGTITDLEDKDRLGTGFRMELDDDLVALCASIDLDPEAVIAGMVKEALDEESRHALQLHAKKTMLDATKSPRKVADKDYVLALTVITSNPSRHDLPAKMHKEMSEVLIRLIGRWCKKRGITEGEAAEIVQREISWWNRGKPACTQWAERCAACDDPLDYGPVVSLETKECHLACYPESDLGELVTAVRFALTSRESWDEGSDQDRFDMITMARATQDLDNAVVLLWEGRGDRGKFETPESFCAAWEERWPEIMAHVQDNLRRNKFMEHMRVAQETDGLDSFYCFAGCARSLAVVHCSDCRTTFLVEREDKEEIREEEWCPGCHPYDPPWCPSQGTLVRLRVAVHKNEAGAVGVICGPWSVDGHELLANHLTPAAPYTGKVTVDLPDDDEAAERLRRDPLSLKSDGVVLSGGWCVGLEDVEFLQTPCTKKAPCFGNLRCKRHRRQASRLYGNLDISAGISRLKHDRGISPEATKGLKALDYMLQKDPGDKKILGIFVDAQTKDMDSLMTLGGMTSGLEPRGQHV